MGSLLHLHLGGLSSLQMQILPTVSFKFSVINNKNLHRIILGTQQLVLKLIRNNDRAHKS